MLMLINPCETLTNNLMIGRDYALVKSKSLYVLDTDDLVVEQVSYDDLLCSIEDGLVVSNIDMSVNPGSASKLRIGNDGWFLCNMAEDNPITMFNGKIAYTKNIIDWLVFNGISYKFMIALQRGVAYEFRCNGSKLFNFKTIKGRYRSCGVAYLFKMNNYIVMRFAVIFTVQSVGDTVRWITVIFNMSGSIIDAYSDMECFNCCYNTVLRTKLIALGGSY